MLLVSVFVGFVLLVVEPGDVEDGVEEGVVTTGLINVLSSTNSLVENNDK